MTSHLQKRIAATPGRVRVASRTNTILVVALVVSAMGPYLIGGLRTEQLVVYGAALLALPIILTNFRPSGGLRFLVPWLVYVLVSLLGVVSPVGPVGDYAPGSFGAGLDAILVPVAVMLVMWSIVPDESAAALLETACRTIAALMSANAAVAVISTRVDLEQALSRFWAPDAEALGSVAGRAIDLGRATGVINQPVEAGMLYTIAGLAAIYVWKDRALLLTLVLSLLTVGGLMSVSKVFVVGGLPVLLGYWLWSQRGHRRAVGLVAAALALLAVSQLGLLDEWTGGDYLTRLIFPDDSDYFSLYSGGRFELGASVQTVWETVWEASPLTGVGAVGLEGAYDSMLAEALVFGGVLGLAAAVAVIIAQFTLAAPGADTALRVFTFCFALVTVAGCFGFSPLTANRVSVIWWLLVCLIVLVRRSQGSPEGVSARGVDSTVPGRMHQLS